MDKFKMLSGDQLVALGAKKASVSLPELGLKEVFPNGSWLEQKQVQNALEARKHLVEVERIDKCGSISHAQWREDLKLAEVTHKCGGHWQYIGHNVGSLLYIKPEEALFLMEMNCLQLTHNDVTVSIQQAYSLLLGDSVSLVQYKVYASLGRLGYKVFRYDNCPIINTGNVEPVPARDQASELKDDGMEIDCISTFQENNASEDRERANELKDSGKGIDDKYKIEDNDSSKGKEQTIELIGNDQNLGHGDMIKDNDANENLEKASESKDGGKDLDNKNISQGNDASEDIEQTSELIDDGKDLDHKDNQKNSSENDTNTGVQNDQQSTIIDIENKDEMNENESVAMEIEHTDLIAEVSSSINLCDENIENTNGDIEAVSIDICNTGSTAFIRHKLQTLYSRDLRPCSSELVHQSFDENLPDLFQKHVVTIKAPEEQFIPRNVFLNKTAYVLNLENLRLKKVIPVPSSSSQSYSSSDDVNEQHVRRIRSSLSSESSQNNWNTQFFPRFPQQTNHFRQFSYWNNYSLNIAFQRQFFQNLPMRFQVFPRMQQIFRCFPPPSFMPNVENSEVGRPRKRKRDNTKVYHLKSIKNLALKLKNLVNLGNTQVENIQALQRLIQTYNQRYKAKLELTEGLDVLENEVILETIDLEDDDQSSPKKKRNCDEDNSFDENFEALKKFALKIKELEGENESSPQHRRAFSKAIKTFNKSYDADIYVDGNYEVINRRHIVIASSDESEGAAETAPKPKRSKKLRNPFYIMKQLAEKQNATKSQPDVKDTSCNSESIIKKDYKYSELLTSNVSKDWLPSEEDFGRAEVIQKNQMNNRILDHSKQFLYDFMKGHLHDNWLDAKIAYWQSCEESAKKFEARSQNQSSLNLNSIVSPEDCTDLQSVLKKLNIIKNNKDVKDECSFRIDFDVYNRDVPNFKKTCKPKPHFRVICIEESSKFPSALDFATHHHKYTDDVSVVFAVVGTASISYLQINTTDLPVYMPMGNPP